VLCGRGSGLLFEPRLTLDFGSRRLVAFRIIDRSVKAPRVSVDTATRIRDAAIRLFAARGYAATGIRDVAEDAGLTTAALYHHMGSKQDLLLAIMRDTMHELITSARAALAQADSSADQLCALARAHVVFNGQNLLAANVSDTEIRSLDPPNRGRIVKLRDTYEDLWAEVISGGIAEGVFEVGDPKLFRLSVIQMCNGISYWYSPAGAASLPAIADQIAGFALAMAGSGDPSPAPRRIAEAEGAG
jgi:AcrR family transcriptional regulator